MNCNDSNPCTNDFCDPSSGCYYETVDCEDDNLCTTESCGSNGCQYTNISCNDYNSCTADSCVPSYGCINEDIPCIGGSNCSIPYCNSILGCQSLVIECTPIDACHTTSCDPHQGCVQYPINGTIHCGVCGPPKIICLFNIIEEAEKIAMLAGPYIAAIVICSVFFACLASFGGKKAYDWYIVAYLNRSASNPAYSPPGEDTYSSPVDDNPSPPPVAGNYTGVVSVDYEASAAVEVSATTTKVEYGAAYSAQVVDEAGGSATATATTEYKPPEDEGRY